MQGQAKKQTESKKRLELLPSRDSCWSFFPTGSAERPEIPAAVGAGAVGSLWRDFGMALVLCGIKTPLKARDGLSWAGGSSSSSCAPAPQRERAEIPWKSCGVEVKTGRHSLITHRKQTHREEKQLVVH